MKFNRVLLISPRHDVEWPGLTPPIGLGYLAESLRSHGIQYEIFDMNLVYRLKHLLRKVNDFNPDLVGMSMITRDYRSFYSALESIKSHNNRVKIVAGGPHVTIFKDQVLRECRTIDYGITREGEQTLIDLCWGERPERDIQGLIFRTEGRIEYTGDREFIPDLDSIPWPTYTGFELNRYFKEISVHTSRGCPYRCIFCARHVLSPRYKARSAKNVADELEYWHQKGYRKFNFEDDNFNLIPRRVYSICDEIEKRGLANLELRCSNGIRADHADRDMLARMREVGFRYLAFGVDAGNNRMLNVVRKGETMRDIENAIGHACDLGYSIKLFFVIGNPTETSADVEDMVKLSRKYPIEEVHFNNVVPYPGTELFEWVKQNNLFLRQPDEYLNNASFWEKKPIFQTPELPVAERVRLTKYLHDVREEIHQAAIRRMFGRHKLIGKIAVRLLSIPGLEKLYYGNRFWRRIMERFRYKQSQDSATPNDASA